MIILNAGVLHRVGPHRLHVALARRLAARGLVSLRLDLAGIGDSLAVAGAQSFRDSAVADTRAAMTALATLTGATRFIVFGLCSGADNALATALVDDRIAALVLIDPPTYKTRRAQVRRVVRQVSQLGDAGAIARWGVAKLEGRARALVARLGRRRAGGPEEPVHNEGREVPPRATYQAMLEQLLARGVGILSIYSGALRDRYNHVDHLFEVFPRLRGRVDRAYFPDANHMFTERAAQAALVATATAWIAERAAPAPPR